MSDDFLHLDGVSSFVYGSLQGYGWDADTATKKPMSNSLQADFLCRLFSVVHAALILVTSTVKLLLRGTSLLLSGLFTLNLNHLNNGAKNFLSIIIQLFVLPILGIVATISPEHACKMGKWLIQKTNSSAELILVWESQGNMEKHLQLKPYVHVFQQIHGLDGVLLKCFLSVTAPFLTIIYLIEGLMRALFTGDIGRWTLAAPCYLVCLPLSVSTTYKSNNYDDTTVTLVHGLLEVAHDTEHFGISD